MRRHFVVIVCLFNIACQKEINWDVGANAPSYLLSDSAQLLFAADLGKDSFHIQANIHWTIATNPATPAWLVTSVNGGSGNASVYVTITGENKTDSSRKVMLIITPANGSNVQPVLVEIVQRARPSARNVYGGTDADQFSSLVTTLNGGYICAGYTDSKNFDVSVVHGQEDAWIVKVDSVGNMVWQKSFGGSGRDFANDIINSTDGGYIVCGHTTSTDGDITSSRGGDDAWIIKLDASGKLLWSKTFGGSGAEVASSIAATPDGGYIFTGFTTSNNGNITVNKGGADIWVVKTDAAGNIAWQHTFGGSGADISKKIILIADGGYLVAGTTQSNDGDVAGNHGYEDAWVIKLSASGDKIWQKTFGGTGADGFYSITEAAGSGFVFAGITDSRDGDVSGIRGSVDGWLVKTDAGGNLNWQRTYGGTAADYIFCITANAAGYLASGVTSSTDGDISSNYGKNDGWLLSLNSGGSIIRETTVGGSGNDAISTIITTGSNTFALAGMTESSDGDIKGYHGFLDAWLMKL